MVAVNCVWLQTEQWSSLDQALSQPDFHNKQKNVRKKKICVLGAVNKNSWHRVAVIKSPDCMSGSSNTNHWALLSTCFYFHVNIAFGLVLAAWSLKLYPQCFTSIKSQYATTDKQRLQQPGTSPPKQDGLLRYYQPQMWFYQNDEPVNWESQLAQRYAGTELSHLKLFCYLGLLLKWEAKILVLCVTAPKKAESMLSVAHCVNWRQQHSFYTATRGHSLR